MKSFEPPLRPPFQLVKFLFCCVLLLSALPVSGQKARYYDRRGMLIDSLARSLEQVRAQQDSARRALSLQQVKLEQLAAENQRLQQVNTRLEHDLEAARGDNLQSSHTNSVLFIFNVIVGLLLLIALLWMLNLRKRGDDRETPAPAAGGGRKKSAEENFEHTLDRIQKLGSLRDKGLLTDEEFNLQKKQLLGD